METMNTLGNKSMIKELLPLIKWSLLRHKYLIPIFTLTQVFLSVAIVCGLALLIPDVDKEVSVYLSSGATTLGIIAVGCVLAAQIVSNSKQDGVLTYQRTLPVLRSNILVADFIIWGIASLPGILMSFIAAHLRFTVIINFSITGIIILILIQLCMISIGFSLAYWLSPNIVSLATQLIMIGGLLFSPITYPADRLPSSIVSFFQFLPFVPASNLIRAMFYGKGAVSVFNVLIICFWLILTTCLSLISLSRRD